MVIERSLEELSEIYHAPAHVDPSQQTGPRYNVAPTQPIRTVRLDREGSRELVAVRWGLIPSWSREGQAGKPLFNARGETVASRPAFRKAFAVRRCLITSERVLRVEENGRRRKAAVLFHERGWNGGKLPKSRMRQPWRA